MPNAFPKMIEERIVSFSIAHPGLGPRRVSSELTREKWGAIIVSPSLPILSAPSRCSSERCSLPLPQALPAPISRTGQEMFSTPRALARARVGGQSLGYELLPRTEK